LGYPAVVSLAAWATEVMMMSETWLIDVLASLLSVWMAAIRRRGPPQWWR
jgi:hypothetical protein